MRRRDFIAARKGTMAPRPAVHALRKKNIVMRALITAWLTVAATPGWAAEASIADGNTLILDGVTYRLDGIEAPQTDQTCIDEKGAAWTCGVAARDRLQEHVGKRDVRCTDRGDDSVFRQKRIGECFVAGEATSLNQWMVQQGWALNADRSAKGRFKADRDNASAERNGLWKGCFVSPEDLRRFTHQHVGHAGRRLPRAEQLAGPPDAVPGKLRSCRPDAISKEGSRCAHRWPAILASIICQAAGAMPVPDRRSGGSVRNGKRKPRATASRTPAERATARQRRTIAQVPEPRSKVLISPLKAFSSHPAAII